MSIDLTVQYPGKVGPATAAFPYGEPRNITAPSDGTGTPWEAAIVKDTEGFKQALLKSSGITPSGTPDEVGASEYVQSILELASGRAYEYTDSGVADAYVLSAKTNQEVPRSYFIGMVVSFMPLNNNTGASSVNVAGLGVRIITRDDFGNTCVVGDLVAGEPVILKFDGIGFVIQNKTRNIVTGTFSLNTAPSAGSSINIAHGLGTDDVDFGATIFGATNHVVKGTMTGVDGRFDSFGNVNVTPVFLITGLPPAGNVKIGIENWHTSSQVVTAKWWIRRR